MLQKFSIALKDGSISTRKKLQIFGPYILTLRTRLLFTCKLHRYELNDILVYIIFFYI